MSKLGEWFDTAWALGRTPGEKLGILWRFTKNVRARLHLTKHRPEQVYRLPTRYGELALRDNFGDVTNLPDLFRRNVYRVTQVRHDGVIIDVGANIGLFAAWAAHHNPDKRIFCFEPLPGNVKVIPLNAPRAVVTHAGLGRERSTVTLSVDEHGAMASTLARDIPTAQASFPVMPLDEFVRANGIDRVAFMKIDTEGMELHVLDGARETLRVTQQIAMETHGPELHRGTLERLRAAGFTVTDAPLKGETKLVFASRQ